MDKVDYCFVLVTLTALALMALFGENPPSHIILLLVLYCAACHSLACAKQNS